MKGTELKVVTQRYDSLLAQLCSLDVDSDIRPFRMTSIICTIGPACDSVEMISEMIRNGMNICRLNMAQNTFDYHGKAIQNIREAIKNEQSPSPVAIAIEIPGQGVRTGCFHPDLGTQVKYEKGDQLILTDNKNLENSCDKSSIYINSTYFLETARIGASILIGDGLLSMIVKDKVEKLVTVEVETEGFISNQSHCHIPKMLPAPLCQLTEKDKDCILFGLEQNVDMIFASWVWSGEVIEEIRKLLGERAAQMKIIANIENYMGIRNFDEILAVADGIMVARGDLGIDLPPEKVFLAQKNLIGRANVAGKPVICAAQMLESMAVNPRPTRAEASDVANAILDGADCVMLSRETAAGRHPIKALKTVCAIAREAEMAVHHDQVYRQLRRVTQLPADSTHAAAIAAVEASIRSQAAAIIVVTNTGRSAGVIARYRPPSLIVAVTKSYHTVQGLHLHRGVYPILHQDSSGGDWTDDVDLRIHHALLVCKSRGYLNAGSTCILVTGSLPGAGWTNTVRTIVVPELDSSPKHYVNIHNKQCHLGI